MSTEMLSFSAKHQRQAANFGLALSTAQKTGLPLAGLFCGIDAALPMQIAAQAGFDAIIIDAEHTPLNPKSVVEHVQTITYHSGGKTLPFVRIPHLESEIASYALDAGAGGVMLPHTETAEQAKRLVAACLFPPLGHRSAPPLAYFYPEQMAAPEGQTVFDAQNNNVAPIVQIESILGVENAEEILSVKGVKGCMIGIGDLFIDFGYASRFYTGPMLSEANPLYLAAVQKVAKLCEKYEIPLLIPAFPLDVEETRKLNPGLVFVGVDGLIYAGALRAAAVSAKEGREAWNEKIKAEVNGVENH